MQSLLRGFPGAGRAPAPRLARRHRGRSLGLAAREGVGFWANRELCPLSCSKKPNQKANLQASKPSVTLSAGRERAARNDKPRVFIFARRWGEFSDQQRGSRAGTSLNPGRPARSSEPEDRMQTKPRTGGHPPNRWSLAPSVRRPAAIPRPRHVLTWIPRSPELRGSRRGGRQEGARHRLSPCPQETPPAIPKLSLHQTHLWFLNIAGDDYPGRVHPGLGEGLRGKEVGSGGKIKLPFCPPLFFFFFLLLVQNSVIFSTQIKQQLVRDAWVSTGMLVLGF